MCLHFSLSAALGYKVDCLTCRDQDVWLLNLGAHAQASNEFRSTRSSFNCPRFHWHSHFCNLGEANQSSLVVVGNQLALEGSIGWNISIYFWVHRNHRMVSSQKPSELFSFWKSDGFKFYEFTSVEQGQDEKPKVIPALLFNFIGTRCSCCFWCCCCYWRGSTFGRDRLLVKFARSSMTCIRSECCCGWNRSASALSS